jgi:Ca2+-dependent lipid-binding protein
LLLEYKSLFLLIYLQPLLAEITDVQSTGKIRVELAPLLPRLPLFGAISFTFMKPPHIDFSLKLGSVDVMNIGAADISMSNLVSHIVKSVISTMALYPKRIVVPLLSEVDVRGLGSPAAVGLLQLTIESGIDLVRKDLGSSDPFVIVKCLDQEAQTEVVPNSLNPVWNHSVDFMIFDKETQVSDVSLVLSSADLELERRVRTLKGCGIRCLRPRPWVDEGIYGYGYFVRRQPSK